MKKLMMFFFLYFHFSCVFAGVELTQFRQDLTALLAETAKQPDRAIKYKDSNGKVAQTAFDPKRFEQVMIELKRENLSAINETAKFKRELGELSDNYAAVFLQSRGLVGLEILDLSDLGFQILVAVADQILQMDMASMSSFERFAREAEIDQPTRAVEQLETFIAQNRFSDAELPIAIARVKKLNRILAKRAKLQSPSFAGIEQAQFRQSVSELAIELAKNPERPIKYTDKNGQIVRATFDPKRFARVIAELKKQNAIIRNTLPDVVSLFNVLTEQYGVQFAIKTGEWGLEALDLFDIGFQVDVAIADDYEKMDMGKVESTSERMRIVERMGRPARAIERLENYIMRNRFSQAELPFAHAKLQQFKLIQEQRKKALSPSN